ncbi:MAG: hypothetical protein AAFV29_04150, partial [Myxococcota bacterium]
MSGGTRLSIARTPKWRRTDTPREGWWPWGVLPMLGLLLIAFVGLIYVPTKVVEHDLVTVVEARLSQAGFRQIEVAADGRRLILTGTTTNTVDDEMLAALAQTSACPTLFGNLACARDVEVSVQRVAPPPPPPPKPA